MIGVDTNVLVRIFVTDNERQTVAALRFLKERSSDDKAFVSSVVLAELVWVLDRTYGYSGASIAEAFDALFQSDNVEIERADLMLNAVAVAVDRNADISDSIIAAIASDAGAEQTVTFDGPAAKRIPGMSLLK